MLGLACPRHVRLDHSCRQPPSRRCRATRSAAPRHSATRSGWASWRSPPAGSPSLSAPSSAVGPRPGWPAFVTFAGFIFNGYQAPVPELAPFANLTWWGWTYDHVAARRPVRLGVSRARRSRGGRPAGDRRSRRSRAATSASPPRCPRRPCRGRCSAWAGRSARAFSLNFGAMLAWGVGVGLFGLALGGARRGSWSSSASRRSS